MQDYYSFIDGTTGNMRSLFSTGSVLNFENYARIQRKYDTFFWWSLREEYIRKVLKRRYKNVEKCNDITLQDVTESLLLSKKERRLLLV